MNRALILGIAIFFAVVGIALLGGEKQVLAGHCGGCGGCSSCDGGCDGGCSSSCSSDCGGCHKKKCCGLFAKLKARKCCGCCQPADCCGHVAPACNGGGCGGEVKVEVKTEAAPAAPAAPAPSAMRKPFGVRAVSFVR